MRIQSTHLVPPTLPLEPTTQPALSTALTTVETPSVSAVRTNWGQNQLSRADAILCPDSVDELQKVIVQAVAGGDTPVVIRGSMHSWSPVAIQDKGTAVNLWKMVKAPKIDTENQIVHVSAGMKLGQLYDHLDEEGLTLAYKPTINDATVAGALATGTHGASREKGLLADQVIGVKLIDSLGRKILVDEQGCHELAEDGSIKKTLMAGPMPLREMKLHRGVLGVIYEISMKCVPAYDLELVQTPMYEDDAFGKDYSRLIRHMDRNEHSDFFWFVPDERVILRKSNKTTEPRKPRNPVAKFFLDDLARSKIATLAMQFIRHVPSAARPIGWVAARTFVSPVVIRDRSDVVESYLPGHAESASQFQAMEYGVPYDRLKEAIEIVRECVEGYEMPVPMYFRRVGDELYFEFIWLRDFPGGKDYAKKLEAKLIEAFGADAHPHEGKIYFQNPWNRVPEEKQKDFMALKATLDPSNTFLNQYMAEYFSGKEDLTDSTTNR